MTTARSSREAPHDILERRLPFDLDAEQAVLGACFITPTACDDLRAELRPEDFFDESNRRIYEHLQGMRDGGQPIDLPLFVARAKKAGIYEVIGGSAYLYRIIQSVANAANAQYYGRLVSEKARLRGIIQASTETLREAYEELESPQDVLTAAEDRLFDLHDRTNTSHARPIKEICHETLDTIEAALRGDGTPALPTGFDDLDRLLAGGFRPGELVIVAARPAMGKSSLATDFACSIARDHLGVFFSLEMTAQNLCERMLSAFGNIDGMMIRNRTLSRQSQQDLATAAAELSNLKLHVDDNSHQRVGEIAASVRMVEQRTGEKVGFIVVDYLQFVAADDQRAPREQQVANTARRLKSLARDRQCPVVAVCSVNRKNEDGNDKRPKLSMLRESGSIEFEADIVLLLHREEYYHRGDDAKEHEGLAEVVIAKQRNGPCGTVELRWDARHTRFQNLAPARLQEFDDYNEDTARFR